MTALMLAVCLITQIPDAGDSHSVRLGISFMASFPSMDDEKDFADMTSDAGLDFQLGSTAWGGSLDLLADIGERFRIRGSVGISRLHGAYKDNYDPLSYILIGMITGGFGFLFPQTEDVVALDDEAVTIEAQAYYVLTRTPGVSLSAGAGPMINIASRRLESPNTETTGNGTGFGMMASLRLDQESEFDLGCLPLMFSLEVGYRFSSVELDDEEAQGFTLDFSGPFVKAGSYIGL